MDSRSRWLENLRIYPTLAQLKRSAFYAENGAQIEAYLRTPQLFSCSAAAPRLQSFLRIAQWNIEKGKRFEAILERLRTNDVLKWADVILLNEADCGMNRSGNRHVAHELAESLGMHSAFAPAHIELTKGVDEELTLDGQNRESLQGNAILSRYPILESCIVHLPVSFEPYDFHEKRYGWRNCLWIRIMPGKIPLWIGAVHLELRNTPKCRARQMQHLLDHFPGRISEPCLIGGDFNTNSFRRGTAWRTLHSVFRMIVPSPARLKSALLHPESGTEPLFAVAGDRGFEWEGLNSAQETARAAIQSLEESGFLPDPLLNIVRKRLEPYEGYLCFKLDWLLGRKLRILKEGQKRDSATGVASVAPGCVQDINYGPERISDHLPIYADLDLA